MTRRVWRSPDFCPRALLWPAIFSGVFLGGTRGVACSLASGFPAVYFIYPPKFSLFIANPRHIAELGFILLLAVTASKAVGVLTDDKPPRKSPATAGG